MNGVYLYFVNKHRFIPPPPIAQSVQDLRTGGRFDLRLGQYSFPWFDDSHCDRIHSSLTAVHCFDNGYVGKAASGLESTLCGLLVKKNSRKARVGALTATIELKYC